MVSASKGKQVEAEQAGRQEPKLCRDGKQGSERRDVSSLAGTDNKLKSVKIRGQEDVEHWLNLHDAVVQKVPQHRTLAEVRFSRSITRW